MSDEHGEQPESGRPRRPEEPTTAFPAVSGENATTAWSRYPEHEEPAAPAADDDPRVSTGPVPPVSPPQDRTESDRDDGDSGGRRYTAAIAVLAVAVLAVAALVGWLLVRDLDEVTTPAAPVTTSSMVTSAAFSAPMPTNTTSAEPERQARCGQDYLWRQFGPGVTVRDCDGEYAILAVPAGDHPVALYHWERQRWAFLADPYAGICRDQLKQIGVPERFRGDFPPCGQVSGLTSFTGGPAPTGNEGPPPTSTGSTGETTSPSSSPPESSAQSGTTSVTDTPTTG